jgi:hypothetical protein
MPDGERVAPMLLLLIGPPAVGKITVGQALAQRTGFCLFHHQVIDLVTEYFPYSEAPDSPFERLMVSYRRLFFEEAARAGMLVITTYGWRFDLPGDERAIRSYAQPFLEHGGRVVAAELQAPLPTRLARNTTPNRRAHKKTDWSTEAALREDAARHIYDSSGALPLDLPDLYLDTEGTTAEQVAETICATLGLA